MAVKLDVETIRTLASPTGDTPLVRALALKQYHKTLVSLHQLHQKLLNEAPELVKTTGFIQVFEVLRGVHPPAQEAVLAYPSVRIWLDTARSLARRQSHVRFPEMHVRMHLEEFGRVVLAAVLKSGSGDFESVTWTDAKGRVVLPGTGSYLESSQLGGYQRVRVRAHNGSITIHAVDRTDEGHFEAVQQAVPTIDKCVELNAVDSDLRKAGRGSFDFEELSLEAIVKWRSTLEQSLAWISECSPPLAREMMMSLRAIIPVRSSSVDVHVSASCRETPGLIALSWTPDASVMVEALVHEYHHQKLNTLLNIDPVIVGPSTDAKYYSPWRPDARPLTGILHGAYAFQAVLQFYKEMFDAEVPILHDTRIRQRMYLLKGQVQTALNTVLDVAQLSPLGEALVDAMLGKIEKLDVALPGSEHAVQQRLDELQVEHRRRWEQENALEKGDGAIQERPVQSNKKIWSHREKRVLDWLHQNAGFDPVSLEGSHNELDPLLNAVMYVFHARTLDELKEILAEATTDQSVLMDLIEGHVAYLEGDYERAAIMYESCLAIDSSNTSFWRYYAFAVRHLARWQDAYTILTNLGRLIRAHGGDSEDSTGKVSVEERLAYVRRIPHGSATLAAL